MRIVAVAMALSFMTATAHQAAAVVQFGVVGSGIHKQYGPQDINGNYLGITSESYDAYVDGGWYSVFPDELTAPSGHQGHVLMAINPYTGEVWTEVPVEYQATNPDSAGTYFGHAPITTLYSPSGIPDDPLTLEVNEAIDYETHSDYLSNTVASATGLNSNAIIITAERRYTDGDCCYFGSYVSTSSDGHIIADSNLLSDLHGHANLPHNMSTGDTVEVGGNTASGPGGVVGHIGVGSGSYGGTYGGGTGYYGFSMNGYDGWIKLNFSGHRSGVRLTEYYFEGPEASCLSGDADCDGDTDLDDILAAVGAFTGPCTDGVDCMGDPSNGGSIFTKVRSEGDVNNRDAPVIGAPPLESNGDGDVDMDDIIDMLGYFTGPLDGEWTIAVSAAGDAGLPDLIYDSNTGEVFLDASDIGGGLQAYNIKNAGGGILNGSYSAILGGPPATSLPTEIGEFQLSATPTPPGGLSIGLVFPAGMDQAALEAFVTGGSAAPSFGGGSFDWELFAINVGPGVPEPATITLLGIGLIGLALASYRHRRAA